LRAGSINVALIGLAIGSVAPMIPPHAAPSGQKAAVTSARDSVTEIASGVYQVGGVVIDANRRRLEVAGHVNMTAGAVEVLLCTRRGKTHESVLVADAEPYHIQVGLLLLGLEPGERPLLRQGDPNPPQGDSVEIRVSWRDSTGNLVEVRAEDMLIDQRTGKPMAATPWIFVGSRIRDGMFEAQLEGNIVTTFHDPATVIKLPRIDSPVTITMHPARAVPHGSRARRSGHESTKKR
jgi:hypothetical protein